jgi:glucuronoarabinoxylan endo-1,4-beta-xylanase
MSPALNRRLRSSPSRFASALALGSVLGAAACGSTPDPVNVSVSVDTSVTHQTLLGFGAATAYQSYLLAGRTDDIFQVLFVDSGLDILRLGNWYQNQAQDATTSTPFADSNAVQIVEKATAARGGTPPKILMSSWTPPAYLKSNGVTRPPFGSGADAPAGTLIQNGGGYAYADFGDWWARSLQAYATAGVVPDWISIQNEPDFYTPQWETCVFGATEGATVAGIPAAGYGQALDAVIGAIDAAGLASPPVVVGPEPTGFNDDNVQHYLDGLDTSELGGIAHHMYGSTSDNPAPDSFAAAMRDVASSGEAARLPTFMTEYQPNAPTMFDTAWLINDALTVEDVSVYLWWELVWSDQTPETGLVSIASGSPSAPYTINDLYYALKHFARWTDPGWIRVDATSSVSAVRASAFVSPDGSSLTLVLLNTDSKDHLVAVDPGGFSFGTFAVYRTSGDTSGDSERAASVTPESDGSIALPSRAIATVTYTP